MISPKSTKCCWDLKKSNKQNDQPFAKVGKFNAFESFLKGRMDDKDSVGHCSTRNESSNPGFSQSVY